MTEMVSWLGQQLKSGLGTLGISIGLMIMMTSNTVAAPAFKLKSPADYFSDTKTLALLDAALAGDLARARQLVAQGANPNDDGPKDNQYNRLRLLHYVIAANNAQAVKVLVEVGADAELSTLGNGPAILFAITLDNQDLLSLLLDLRPIQLLATGTIKTLLFRSVAMPRPRCLALLLQRGAPIDFPDGAGYTIMMRAMDAQDYDLAEWILLQGASVKIEAGGGMTPAYSLEYDLKKFKPGSPTHNKVLRMKQLMEARGAVFPALSPEEVRARRRHK